MTSKSSPPASRFIASEFERGLLACIYPLVTDDTLDVTKVDALVEYLSKSAPDEITPTTIDLISTIVPRLFTSLSQASAEHGAALSRAVVQLHCLAQSKKTPTNGSSEKALQEAADLYGLRYFLFVEYERGPSELLVDVMSSVPSPMSPERQVNLRGTEDGEELFVTLERIGDESVEQVFHERLSTTDHGRRWHIELADAEDVDHLLLSIASNGSPIVRAKLSELTH